MKLNTTEIREEAKHVGETVWVCSYNQPDLSKKPLRNVKPTLCKILHVADTDKNVYYSCVYFAPLKKGGIGVTKKVISPVDNTGYRSRAGNEIDVYTTEEEAIAAYQEQWDNCHPPIELTKSEKLLEDVVNLFDDYLELLGVGDGGSASEYCGKMMELLEENNYDCQ